MLAGLLSAWKLPVSPLPRIDLPTILVQANFPGASPETMAATIATPLERVLGRISGLTEMTSSSSQGATRITLQFDLDRTSDSVAREVQAALNAAASVLPSGMPSLPTYRKTNPSETPILILTLTSTQLPRAKLYDLASSILVQKISQIEGVGQVTVGGSSLPAIRVALNTNELGSLKLSTETVRQTITQNQSILPQGTLTQDNQQWQLLLNDQLTRASDYAPAIVTWKNQSAIRLQDVADVSDSEQDRNNLGLANGIPSVVLIINREPSANVVATVDRIREQLPNLKENIPATAQLDIAMDRTTTIRASLHEVERTLLLSIVLVVLVVLLFLRQWRAAVVALVAVPVSIVGTLSIMYACGFSLNNLSLTALVVAAGFVVDDAVVVLENIIRYLEQGAPPREAAKRGAEQVRFTVLSMSVSLIAVFIPIFLMQGFIGRLFAEFAWTLSAAIAVSMIVSLTITPVLSAYILKIAPTHKPIQTEPPAKLSFYARSLSWCLRHPIWVALALFTTILLNVYLYIQIPKGFFPQQDTGTIMGGISADQNSSFESMRDKLIHFVDVIKADEAVASVVGFTGGGRSGNANLFIALKPKTERNRLEKTKGEHSADQVITRLRTKLSREAGASLFLQAMQDIRIGGRAANSQFQYTLKADSLTALREWEPIIRRKLAEVPEIKDINTDQEDRADQINILFNREAMARLGITQQVANAALANLFSQRLVATTYQPLNQYRVVLESNQSNRDNLSDLDQVQVVSTSGTVVPLSAIASWELGKAPSSINHQDGFAASTISFNLAAGVAMSEAQTAVESALASLNMPKEIVGGFQGTAKAYQQTTNNQHWLILAAIVAVYLVLGILYESWLHPITILSTLPSAGVGALLTLMLMKMEFSLMALVGVILLIGIVKKNAIMMVDFALQSQKTKGVSPREAIYQACLLRLRPILMTTVAAIAGALPLALGTGDGAELRQPLGVAMIGGLILSQVLTLYTTPIVYLGLERLKAAINPRKTV